ncbi:uncharacterized protein LOC107043182 isoform X2 [Diachasma alloeum]|uniref:uncharacterized protein LOC107043182 isoform X2 n=1 Tax=Diachasma alloeum TaxID=454923 RepID=UPI0007383B88|nr:uncharacterized protein LOC107043182 isoform X2 [Diachasma alloeum]
MQLQYLSLDCLSVSVDCEITPKIMDDRTTPNPPTLHNRSFLHRNGIIGVKDCKLEGLALKRKSLPLQLIPTDIVTIENGTHSVDDVSITPIVSNSSEQLNFKVSDGEPSNEDINSPGDVIEETRDSGNGEASKQEVPTIAPAKSVEDLANKEDVDTTVSWEKLNSEIVESTCQKKPVENNAADLNDNDKLLSTKVHFKVKPKWGFTRTVMRYVPNRAKRFKKMSKTRQRKIETRDEDCSSGKISQPTNFVYLAGTARWTWLNDAPFNSHSGPVITHAEKFARLPMVGEEDEANKQVGNNEQKMTRRNSDSQEQTVKINDDNCTRPRANSSFLWSNLSKRPVEVAPENDEQENYDDVGVSVVAHENSEDVYDDVGPPVTSVDVSPSGLDYDDDDQVYDDVMPPSNLSSGMCNGIDGEGRPGFQGERGDAANCTVNSDQTLSNKKEDSEEDLIYMRNDYSSVDEDADDEDTLYDDVGVNCQSRVNSLYAGSTIVSHVESSCGKESEWEDLEESMSEHVSTNNQEGQSTPSKKKTGRWTRKVRRQRSKALRKNSSRTSSQTIRVSRESVVSDTASDDSNYETLCSEPSDSINGVETSIENLMEIPAIQQAPSRPVPPPPRESSLTETFGKRIKMLRRTWSITKGSIGRMRRKTSTSNDTTEPNVDDTGLKSSGCENYQSDSRKSSQAFNLRKHFQRNVSSYSTFYLDNENEIKGKNNNGSVDEIYGNTNGMSDSESWKTDALSISRTMLDNSDDYNMLAEEPLYQFYAAATVRGAFQSDSDSNYGEDDSSSISSPSTSELGRPGHRTLWCETPQVKNTQLLEKLTPDEKKIQEAKFEIFTSEASYLNSLRVLVNEFLINHELVYESLSVSDREKLFGKVPSVLIASERLLGELESTWRQDPMLRGLPNVLLQHAERCSKIYIDYCSNQVSIDSTLKELKSRKSKFLDTVTRIEAHPACQSLSLHSFLMLPMQRVTRLPLLADAVLSKLSTDHEERLDWEKVVSVLGGVVTECNEGARTAGRQIEMETLARKLVYSAKVTPIDLRGRYLVRSGPVTQIMAKAGSEYVLTFRKKYQKTPLYLLLLTDYILVAKLKSNTSQEDTYTVIDACKRNLVELEKVPDDSPFAGRHAMVLTLLENHNGRHVEYILSCQNGTERERWLDAVFPPVSSSVGETLYESWDCPQVMALYSYAPSQPDELSLQPGDVINVVRKMADGWNHGEKLVGGEQGWFPGNFVKEVASEHVRARNLRQRHRLLALSECLLQQRAKQPMNPSR